MWLERARPLHHPVVWTAFAMIALQLAFRGWAALGGWFYSDDYEFLAAATGRSLDLGYLFAPHDVHLMPGGVLLSWLVAQAGPFNWTLAAVVVLVLQLGADLACLAMLLVLFGRRWWCLLPLGFYLYSTTTLTAFLWWSAAVNQLPMHAALFLAVACHVTYLRTGRVRWGLGGVLAVALGLLFFEKSLLILLPLALLTLLYFGPSAGGVRRRALQPVLAHWRVWAAYAVLAAVYLVGYLQLVPSPADDRGPIDYLGLLDSMLRTSLVVSSLGGPWVWSDRNPPLGQVATPAWAAAAAGVVLLGLVALTLRRRRGAWRALVVAVPYVLLTWFLLAQARGAALGSFAGQELRYLADAAPVLTLCLGLAVLPLRGSAPAGRGRRAAARPRLSPVSGRRLVAVVLAAVVVGAVVSNVAYARMWTGPFPAKAYVQATERAVTNDRLAVADSPVPELVMSATSFPSNLPSRMFAPLGDRLVAEDHGTDLSMLGSDGVPYGAVIEGGPTSAPGPRQGCGYLLRGSTTTVPMAGPDAPYFWWLQLSYLSSARGEVELSVGGRTHLAEVRPGAHRFFLQGSGAVDPVTVRSATSGLVVCLDRVQIGTISALEPLG